MAVENDPCLCHHHPGRDGTGRRPCPVLSRR